MKYLLLPIFVGIMLMPALARAYPGCQTDDRVIGGQIWSSCNALSKGKGSSEKSGWFMPGDRNPIFISWNGATNRLEFQRKKSQKDYQNGPCAKGYRLPTRGEWETAIGYSRANSTTLANLLGLVSNGGYRTFRDTDGDIMVEARQNVTAAYMSSTYEKVSSGYRPTILHLGATYSGYRIDGTEIASGGETYRWQYGDTGLEIIGGESTEMANVRCIKK